VVSCVRKENRDDRCKNCDGRVSYEAAPPMARRMRRPSLRSRSHRFDEPITPPRHRLDVSRAQALVAKNRPEAADDDVETVIKVPVPVGPQPARDLLASDQFAGPL